MKSVNVGIAPAIGSARLNRKNPSAENRIKQLLGQSANLKVQTAYLHSVVSQMIPLLPKSTVSRILVAAKKF
jgi:hypothetical protein